MNHTQRIMRIQRRTLNKRPGNENNRRIDDNHGKQQDNMHSLFPQGKSIRHHMARRTSIKKLTNEDLEEPSSEKSRITS